MLSRCLQPPRATRPLSTQGNLNLCLTSTSPSTPKSQSKKYHSRSPAFLSTTRSITSTNHKTNYVNNIVLCTSKFHPSFQFHRRFSDETTSTTSSSEEMDLSKFTKEIEIKLPELVEDNGAKIVKWYKGAGEIIKPGDTICDIETDMFTFEYDIEDECIGVMKEIILKEGEKTNDPHSPICIILHEPEEVEEKEEEAKKENDEKKDEK